MNFAGPRLCALLFLVLAGPNWIRAAGLDEAIRLYERGEFQKAAEQLTSIAAAAPGDPAVRLWLGKSHLKARKWDDAVKELEKAVEIAPSDSVNHLWLGRAYGEKASRTSVFTRLRWAGKLRREFETAVRIAPGNLDARFDLLEFYLQAPGIVGGGRDKAEAQVREIAERNPRLGYTARSRFYVDDKKWDLAREELEKSVREFPDEPDAYLDLADFLLERGDVTAAESNARKALKIKSDSARARLLIASALVRRRSGLAEAETLLRGLASGPLGDADPDFAAVHYWLGQALLAQDKRPQAKAAFETSLRFDPEHAEAKASLAHLR